MSQRVAHAQSDLQPFPHWYVVLLDAIEKRQSRANHLDLGLPQAREYLLKTTDDTFRLIEEMRHYLKLRSELIG
jgi:hypothetical protein